MASDNIQGTVTDSDGNTISNAIVALFEQDNPNNVITTQADSSGNYLFKDHPDGDGTTRNWHLAARDPNDFTQQFRSLHSVSASLPVPIPDSGDAHLIAGDINATDGDILSSWSGSNGQVSMTATNSPTYETNVVNGEPAVRFTRSNTDYFDDSSYSISQPAAVVVVGWSLTSSRSSNGEYFSDTISGDRFITSPYASHNQKLGCYASSWVDGSTAVTSPTVSSFIFDGTNSKVKKDGYRVAKGNAGSNDLDGFRLGAAATGATGGPDRWALDGYIAEFVTLTDINDVRSMESYLINKYNL